MLRLLAFLALVVSASASGTCKVGYNGQCSSFNGQNIKQAFPSNCYVPLATGACGSDSWLIFFSTFTMTFNVRYEGFIYAIDNGTTFSRSEFSVALNLAGTVATITAVTVPTNTCGLCNNNGNPQCLSPITTTPLPTTTVKPTTTEEITTVVVTSAPPSTCTVFTSGLCTGFNGCNATTTFPPNDNVLLAMGACEGETWVVFYSTITMSFNIKFEGFIYPCHGGNKTVFGSVSVEVNIEMTMAIILVNDLPAGLTCGLCSSSGSSECSGTPPISSTHALTTTEEPTTTEEATTSVASLPPVSTCTVSTGGHCTGFSGCKSTTTFPSNTEIVLAKGDCDSEDAWIVFYSTITMSFNIKFEGFIYPCNAGNKTVFGSVSVEVNIEMTLAVIMVADMPSGITCGLCSSSESVECESTALPPSEAPSTPEKTTEVATTVVSTSEVPSEESTCIVSTGGECTGFNGCKSVTTFPSNTEIILAKGDCEAEDTWIVFYSTITMSFNIKFEGFIYPCHGGNKTVFGSVSVEVNIEMTMAIILVDNKPSGIDCGLCGSETVECSSSTPEAVISSEVPSTTEESMTSVATSEASTVVPPSTCIVSTGGECTGFNGCSSKTTFPENTEIVLAKGDCDSEDTWIVFYSTITMSFNIKYEGFIYPCHGGNKTTFGSVSVEVNIEVTMAIILVDNKPSSIDCGICGSETVECTSASTDVPSTAEDLTTTEEVTSSFATSEASSELPPSSCIVSTGGECTGFSGCKSVTTFPANTEIVLAKGDCDSEDTWIVFYSTITMSFNIKFEGFIYPCHGGNKTTFGSVSVEVNIEVSMAIVLVGGKVPGDCGLCGSETVECSSSTPEALISSEEPTTTEESITSVATSEASTEVPLSTCIVSTRGDSTGFNGCSSKTTFPENTEIVLAKGDCEAEDTWVVFYSTITMSFNIKFEGFIYPCHGGNKTTFGSVSVEVNIEVTMAIILVDNKPSGVDCGLCGSETIECSSSSPALTSTEEPISTSSVATTVADEDCGCAGFCMVSISGGSISFDGSEFVGDYPDDCILPLASSDCGDDKKWQILLSKATSSFFLVVDGEIIVLGFGSIYVKYEMTVFVTYQTVFVILPGKSVENDCSVCGKPDYKECIDFPGLPSTPYPWVTKAPSTIPPCVYPSSLSP